jgi:hypothetical protein
VIERILKASGIPYRESRYPNPPKETYAVFFDDLDANGPDPFPGVPKVVTHNVTVELYEPKQDHDAEAAIEAQLDAEGLHWTKQSRYWLQNVQRYQVIYEFTYTLKGGFKHA